MLVLRVRVKLFRCKYNPFYNMDRRQGLLEGDLPTLNAGQNETAVLCGAVLIWPDMMEQGIHFI